MIAFFIMAAIHGAHLHQHLYCGNIIILCHCSCHVYTVLLAT